MILPEAPTNIHFIWRCHNHSFLLNDDHSKQFYLDLLAKNKEKYGIQIYGYAVMSNHFHAVMRIGSRSQWQNFARTVNSQLAVFVNKNNKRCGQVVMDRPRTIVLESERDVLAVMRYIELNPLRAGMTKKLKNYRWSSYQHHAQGREDPVVDDFPALLRMADSQKKRQMAYRQMFTVQKQDRDMHPRPDFVRVYFIGAAHWTLKQSQILRAQMREKQAPG